jgi:glycosyltransferase involved in cell wall biosynthesis
MSTPQPPLPVSVVIPAWNRETMIGRAVDSALAQRPRPPVEVVVVDNGSVDDTGAVAERHGARVIRHPENRGPAGARNTGVRAATQPWIALLDSDDEWLPDLLASLWPFTASDHVLVAGAGFARAADPAGDYYGGTPSGRPHVLRSPRPLLAKGCFIGPSSVLLRRDAFEAAGGLDEELSAGEAEDLDLWIRMLERGTALLSPRVVTLYHLDDDGSAGFQTDRMLSLDAHEKLAWRWAGRPWWSRTLVERSRGIREWDTARIALRSGDRAAAARAAGLLVTHPLRLVGAADLIARRVRLRRRRWTVSRDARRHTSRAGRPDTRSCAHGRRHWPSGRSASGPSSARRRRRRAGAAGARAPTPRARDRAAAGTAHRPPAPPGDRAASGVALPPRFGGAERPSSGRRPATRRART